MPADLPISDCQTAITFKLLLLQELAMYNFITQHRGMVLLLVNHIQKKTKQK